MNALKTPSLLLDKARVGQNAERMSEIAGRKQCPSAAPYQDAQMHRGGKDPDGGT